MEFKKKLRIRMFVGIALIVLGVAMIVIFNVIKPRNEFFSSFGFAFAVVGVVRLRNYLIITKSEERIKAQEISENDERNIAIANKAKSITFTIFVMVAGIGVVVLQLLEKTHMALLLSGALYLLLVVYWITYWIVYKKL